jgi:hypothetical protein
MNIYGMMYRSKQIAIQLSLALLAMVMMNWGTSMQARAERGATYSGVVSLSDRLRALPGPFDVTCQTSATSLIFFGRPIDMTLCTRNFLLEPASEVLTGTVHLQLTIDSVCVPPELLTRDLRELNPAEVTAYRSLAMACFYQAQEMPTRDLTTPRGEDCYCSAQSP